jgi:hypothetical protein
MPAKQHRAPFRHAIFMTGLGDVLRLCSAHCAAQSWRRAILAGKLILLWPKQL